VTPKRPHPKYSQFRFDAGSLALNFVTTVKHRGAQSRDLLSTPAALADWLRRACFDALDVEPSFQDVEEALLLREAIYRAVRALIHHQTPQADDVNRINITSAYSLAVPQIDTASYHLQWVSTDPINACLADIARNAVIVIGNGDRRRLKMCDNPSCQMLFFDRSFANRRRWCAMPICGNRAKVTLHRQRKKGADSEYI
jgi:predicted RNA-binding Zn ribbon-like protein